MFPSPTRFVASLSALSFVLTSACGPETSAVLASSESSAAESGRDPRLDDARVAIERGFPDAAWTLLEQVGDDGLESGLLRARACIVEGDAVGAMRELETVRPSAGAGGESREAEAHWIAEFHATEVEILAALDRLVTARESLRTAYARVGNVPVLERARGVILLRTPGAATEALAALEGAYEQSPELPFLGFPLSQARLLVGREVLANDPERSLSLVRAALAYDPLNAEFRELEAEALSTSMLFEEALAIYETLEQDGKSYGDTRALLHQKLGTRLLLQGQRDKAAEHYVRARALGLDDEGLGFGADVLATKAFEWIDTGIAAFDEQRYDLATDAFKEALVLSPKNLEARNHLGVAYFRAEDYSRAARAWATVLKQAKHDEITLPDPVHLNLARAWRLAEKHDKARKVLSDYLDGTPEGTWVDATRELLEHLELEELVGGE